MVNLNWLPRLLYKPARIAFDMVGLEVRRRRPTHEEFPRLAHFLKQFEVDTVLDLGANRGQFAKDLFSAGYLGKIISVEPIPALQGLLEKESRRISSNWIIAPPLALSDKAEIRRFHISENLASSSLLTVLSASVEAAPESATSKSIDVQTIRLDELLNQMEVKGHFFIKIDTQGTEMEVLAGLGTSVSRAVGIKLEISMLPLYAGQSEQSNIENYLTQNGFECWDIVPGFRNRTTGRLLQYDGIYFKV